MAGSVENIKIFKDFISPEDLTLAMSLLKNCDFSSHNEYEPDYWKDRVLASDNVPKEVTEIIQKTLAKLYPWAKDFYKIDLAPLDTKYEGLVHKNSDEFEHALGLHSDDYTNSDFAISILIYWNDDFEGGELEFPELGFKYKPKAGDVVTFLPTDDYVHEVHLVTKGTRYSSPYWYRLPNAVK